MAGARRLEEWDRTAALQASVLNLFREQGKSAIEPFELNPFRVEHRAKVNVRELKDDLLATFKPGRTRSGKRS